MIYKSNLHYNIFKYFARVTQFFSWPICFVFFHLFFKLKINGKRNMKLIKSPFILVSNHIAYYDSFVFRLMFGIFTLKLPLRMMAVKVFDSKFMNFLAYIGIIDLIYLIFGVFVVIPGLGIKRNLEEAIGIIKNGGNVVIYPEGSIIKDDKIGVFKKGAAVLAHKTGATILPISLRFRNINCCRKEFIINIGNPIKIDENISSIKATEMLREIISGLYKVL